MSKIRIVFVFIIVSNLYAVEFPEFIHGESVKGKRDCNNCRSFEESGGVNDKPAVFICISFSVPENAWLELDKTPSERNKIFVVRGIPNNSFEAFGNKISALKEKGFNSSIEINPKLFNEYEITKVPSFVIKEEDNYNKVSGNISLETALKILEKQVK